MSLLVGSLARTLRAFLSDVQRFACAIRRVPLSSFPTLVSAPDASVSIPVELLPVARVCASLGFRFTPRCAALCTDIFHRETIYTSSVASASDVSAFTAAIGDAGVVSYLDKNAGLGCIVCPHLFWHTLRDTFWRNPDYSRTTLTHATLLVLHLKAYTSGRWSCVGPFQPRAPPAHTPFLFGKYKSNRKNRPVLSAFRHCLKTVYKRIALALRVCLLTVVRAGAWDANVSTTFDAPRLLVRDVNRAVSELLDYDSLLSASWIHTDAYAGDVSSMFDKLPCTVVMRAVAWVLDSASALSSRYNLRSSSRRHVTINLRDPTGHRIGISYGGEGVLTVAFPMLLNICEHYCFQTYFLFADTFFRLQLGVPQGGSLSDPLSKAFCIYCEHQWLASLFDLQRFPPSGVIRSCDMTSTGRAYFSAACGFPLLAADDSPLAFAILKRYADDCRAVVVYDARSPTGAAVANAFINAYRSDCYIRPCSLDDEERGRSFHFMQGYYTFFPQCAVEYVVKNALPLLTRHQRLIRSLQHYDSYGQSPSTLRYATVMGKLAEIDAISSSVHLLLRALLLQAVEFSYLGYPCSLLCRALKAKFRQTGCTFWLDACPLVTSVMRTFADRARVVSPGLLRATRDAAAAR